MRSSSMNRPRVPPFGPPARETSTHARGGLSRGRFGQTPIRRGLSARVRRVRKQDEIVVRLHPHLLTHLQEAPLELFQNRRPQFQEMLIAPGAVFRLE